VVANYFFFLHVRPLRSSSSHLYNVFSLFFAACFRRGIWCWPGCGGGTLSMGVFLRIWRPPVPWSAFSHPQRLRKLANFRTRFMMSGLILFFPFTCAFFLQILLAPPGLPVAFSLSKKTGALSSSLLFERTSAPLLSRCCRCHDLLVFPLFPCAPPVYIVCQLTPQMTSSYAFFFLNGREPAPSPGDRTIVLSLLAPRMGHVTHRAVAGPFPLALTYPLLSVPLQS